MSRKAQGKSNHRFVMYIPDALRKEIEEWTDKLGMTFAEFGREAFEMYLDDKKRQERKAQLAETCRLFTHKNINVLSLWGSDKENIAA